MTSHPDAGAVLRARNATMAVFAANGVIFASWMSRVPDVKALMHLTPGRLSLLLLSISAGSVIGLPLAGRIGQRVGAAAAVRLGTAIALPGVALAGITVQAGGGLPLVAAGLFLVGFGIGVWDVSQNYEGTLVEGALGRSIMPWFHAAFSLGTVLGAVIGAGLTYLRVPLGVHMVVGAVAGLIAVLVATNGFLAAGPHEAHAPADEGAPTGPRSAFAAWAEPRTLLIGVLVLAAAFTEGTANDWMAVAFVDGHGVGRSLGVIALAVFLTFMTLGRILGTRLLDRYGRVAVLRVMFGAAVAGCALVILSPAWLAYLGAAVWGLGASLGFPVGMSAAADDPRHAAARLSVVSTVGYGAFLAGPPLLGFLGDHFGVLHSLSVVGAVSVLALLVVRIARPPVTTPAVPATQGS